MKSRVKHRIGESIRRVRERRGITLKQVAEEIGVSTSLLSQIERNRVSPSLDTLLAVTRVLSIDPDYLFREFKQDKQVWILRQTERGVRQVDGVTYQQLSLPLEDPHEHDIEAVLLDLESGSSRGDQVYGHPGREFGIVLEGRAEFRYGTKVYSLETGDSLGFSAEIPHELVNIGNGRLSALWVITPLKTFA